jgi:hypothetical protein
VILFLIKKCSKMKNEVVFGNPETKEGLLHWQKVGGGSLRMQGRIIKPLETFWAAKEDIPQAFIKSLILMEDSPKPPTVRRRRLKEEPVYKLEEKGNGWYNIVDNTGKVVNEKSLRIDDAKQLLESL